MYVWKEKEKKKVRIELSEKTGMGRRGKEYS